MKRIISTTFLVLAFCFAAFAQVDENVCPKISISAPGYIQFDESLRASASYEKENQPSTSQFNWTIIRKDKVLKIGQLKTIKIEPTNWIKGGTIILLAESLDKKCPDPVVARVAVIPNEGLPYKMDEYSELSWNDERERLQNIAVQIEDFKESELFIFLSFDKKTAQTERKNYLQKVLNELSVVRKLEKDRITLLISESEEKRIWFQPVPKELSTNYAACEDCLTIKGENFARLENLFRPKPTTKKLQK